MEDGGRQVAGEEDVLLVRTASGCLRRWEQETPIRALVGLYESFTVKGFGVSSWVAMM